VGAAWNILWGESGVGLDRDWNNHWKAIDYIKDEPNLKREIVTFVDNKCFVNRNKINCEKMISIFGNGMYSHNLVLFNLFLNIEKFYMQMIFQNR
jgi:hypothetical protein